MYNLVTKLNKNFVKDLAPYPGNIMLRERIINSYFVIISYIIYYQTLILVYRIDDFVIRLLENITKIMNKNISFNSLP